MATYNGMAEGGAWLDEQVAVGLLSVSDGRYALTDEGRFARVEHAGAELAL